MNYFFGIKNTEFESELQIPRFQNRNPKIENISLFKATIEKNSWKIDEVKNSIGLDSFYILNSEEIDNETIFFLSYNKDLINFDKKKLKNLNNFTDTYPDFRANFKIKLKNGGFSSFQSEYPFRMVEKKGSILSSVSSISNSNAEKNYIFIKNIFKYPIQENYYAYLVDIKNKRILEKINVKTNYTNSFEINKTLIKPEIFLVTDKYLGIPMYVSANNKHLSFEHTHPPHEYILSNNRFLKVSNLKKEINEIIN